ncbi:MAG: TonB-dependent receptor [Bryobacterales bacterium]|nr:TonB-dependent receptor [Bryobacterales bacterium]
MNYRCLYICLLALLSAAGASAQTIRASIYGEVSDSTGSAVPGATIRAVHVATSTEVSYVTDERGNYDFPRLVKFGEYRLEAEAKGFQKLIREGIVVVIDQRARVDLELRVGEVSQTIEVSGDAPLLETSNSTPGAYVPKRLIDTLPLFNRQPLSLVLIAPGVTPQGTFGPILNGAENNPRPLVYTISNFSVNGSRGVTNEIIVDGLSINVPEGGNGGAGTAGPALSPNADATEEVKVLSNTFSAEYGKSGGGVVTMTLKSGTNEFHGSLFEYFRNDKLDANPWFSNAVGAGRAKLRQNMFGGAIGGPVWKNRTFFFFDYQAYRQVSQGAPVRSSLPTLPMLDGDFSQLRNSAGQLITIHDPLTAGPGAARAAFAGNVIPRNRMDPVALKVLSFVPRERRSAGDPFTALGNNTYSNPVKSSEGQWDLKIDHSFSQTHHLTGRISWWDVNNRNTPTLPGVDYDNPNPADTGVFTVPRRSYQPALGYTWTINPHTIFDIRAGYTRYEVAATHLFGCQPLFNSCQQPFNSTQAGFPSYLDNYSDAKGFPGITFSAGYQSLGVPNQQWYTPDSIAGQSTLTRISGRHVWKAGFEWRRQHYIRGGGSDRAGIFRFSDAMTRRVNNRANTNLEGNPIASFLLGYADSGSISRVSFSDVKSDYFAGFFQDDFKVSSKLTLNLGLRWDVSRPMWDRLGQISFLDLNATNPLNGRLNAAAIPAGMQSTLFGGLEFPNQGRLAGINNTMSVDWNNIAPRLGLAYRVGANTVVRAGFGILFKTQLGEAVPPPRESFSVTNAMLASADGARPLNTLSDPFPGGDLLEPTRGALGLLTNVGLNAPGILGSNAEKVPYIVQWNLNIQHQLPGQILAEIGYTGTQGKQLNRPPIDFNELDPSFVARGNQLNQLVTNPFFGVAGIPSTSLLARPTVQLGQLLRPHPHFLAMQAWDRNGASSKYHGMTARVEKRFTHGLTLLGSFTASKLMDDFSGIPNWQGAAPARDRTRYDASREWAVNEEDVSRRMVVSYSYELPIGKGKSLWNTSGAADAVLGGWQISGIHTMSTGIPIQVIGGTAYHSFGAGVQRPNSTGVSPGKTGRAQDRLLAWFDKAQFTNPEPFTLGNLGRTLPNVRTDGLNQWDFSAAKVFPIRERFRVEYRAFFRNFLNTPDFAHPERTFTSPDFGRVTATAIPARQVQMELRFKF